MKITIFTGNQLRHKSFVNSLTRNGHEVIAFLEVSTLFQGEKSGIYSKSQLVKRYMRKVKESEKLYFGDDGNYVESAKSFPMLLGELSDIDKGDLLEALNADLYITFGSSYIKGWLCDFLIENRALNLHMGLSPYYRGNSCNFWAVYDMKPNYVGASWHFLSKGLDSGPVLFHSIPEYNLEDPFNFTMKAVKTAHLDLLQNLDYLEGKIYSGQIQDRNLEIRYSRFSDFTDEVINNFFEKKLTPENFKSLIENSERPMRVIKAKDIFEK